MHRKPSILTSFISGIVFLAFLLGSPATIRSSDIADPVVPEIQTIPLMPPGNPAPPASRDGASDRESRVLTHDFRTGQVFEQEFPTLEEVLGPRYTEAGVGIDELLADPESVSKNFSDWTLEPYPASGTRPRQVKLIAYYTTENGQVVMGFCSGTLIDPLHVVTAAHCVWAHDLDNFGPVHAVADSMEVIPAYQDGGRPFGTSRAAQIHVWSQWPDDHDYDHDIALITLDRPVGAITGWWGYGYNEDCNFWEALYWRHAGYPSEDPFDGENMYSNEGSFDDCDPYGWDNRASWDGPSWGGSSGSGSLRTLTNAVYAVLSTSNREDRTEVCKITAAKFGHIQQIITDDKPAAFDLWALDVDIDASCESGDRPDTLEFTVVNYSGEPRSGTWDYQIYLSDDDFISSADTYVGEGSFYHDFTPRGAVRVFATPPLLPADMPEGTYFAGVILNHTDANNDNNASHGYEADVIFVDCPASDPPSYIGPFYQGTCLPVDLIFDWNAVAGLAEYQLQVGTSCGDGTALDLIRTEYTWYGLDYNTTYYWRVRSKAQCGSWGDWGPCWTFTTRPDLTEVMTPLTPSDGRTCMDTDFNVIWTGYPNREMYEFRIDTRCGEGTVQQTIDNSIPVSLELGTVYHWSVRVQTDCNGWWTDWSPCYTFETRPDWTPRPQMSYPPDGSGCVNANPYLSWVIDPEMASYDVEVGTACGVGTIYSTTENYLHVFGLQDGLTYFWRLRAYHECGPVSDWSPCWTFTVDDQPPATPPNLVSDRPVATWSNDNTIFVDWDPSPDNCETPLYSCVFNQAPETIPDNVPDAEATEAVSEALDDGTDHWFHVKAIDAAHNMSPTVHLGPFWIDTTPPPAPVIDFTTVDAGVVTGPTLLTIDWQAVQDAASGLDGYSWWIDLTPTPSGEPDLVADTVETSLSFELEINASFWFFVRAVDVAGNGSGVVTLGPFICDRSMLGCGILEPGRGEVLTEGDIYQVQWFVSQDSPAVLASGRLEYSLDGGETYFLVANLTPAEIWAQSFAWNVPAAQSDQALLKLSITDTEVREVHGRSERFGLHQVSGTPEPAPGAGRLFALGDARPNPFNADTAIPFELSRAADVRLSVFDVSGRLIRTLVDGRNIPAGIHDRSWDGRDAAGVSMASGAYFYYLEVGGQGATGRVILLK